MSRYWIHAGLQLKAKEFRYITNLKISHLFTPLYQKAYNLFFQFETLRTNQITYIFVKICVILIFY